MRNNYRIMSSRCCENCAFVDRWDYGELRCYKFPKRSKDDIRRVLGCTVCDDHQFEDSIETETRTVPIDDPNKTQYTCEVKIEITGS